MSKLEHKQGRNQDFAWGRRLENEKIVTSFWWRISGEAIWWRH